MRVHRKVWLWWGKWWAAQLYVNAYLSLGVHVDFRRPYLDLHFLWLSVSVGNNPIFTDEADWKRNSCRGFVTNDRPPVL